MEIHLLAALADNYIWIVAENERAVVVDPGEAEPVLAFLMDKGWTLDSILLTHEHDDHIAGVTELVAAYPTAQLFGPAEVAARLSALPQLQEVVDGDQIQVLNYPMRVYLTAGHTAGHISYLLDDLYLFCGDALFSGGCGRVFTGDYAAQFQAMDVFRSLADAVEIYCGHEYTQTNLRYGQSVEPANEALRDALVEADALRADGVATLPSSIGREKLINVLLRAETLEEFTQLRLGRDNF